MGLDLAERGLVGQTAGDRRLRPDGLRLHEFVVAAVLRLRAGELVEQRLRAVALDGEQPDEDLVAERWRPGRSPHEPRAQRSLAARGQAEDAAKARSDALIAPRHQAAPLELVEELIDLADVRMPEGAEPLIEQLQQLVSVGLTLAEQRQQRVPEVHDRPPQPPTLSEECASEKRSAAGAPRSPV